MCLVIIKYIILIIFIESVTEVLSKSLLFEPVREWFFNRRKNYLFKFTHNVLDCGYCLSVWVALLTSLLFNEIILCSYLIDWFIVGIVLHRLSNVTHNIIDRTRKDLI